MTLEFVNDRLWRLNWALCLGMGWKWEAAVIREEWPAKWSTRV